MTGIFSGQPSNTPTPKPTQTQYTTRYGKKVTVAMAKQMDAMNPQINDTIKQCGGAFTIEQLFNGAQTYDANRIPGAPAAPAFTVDGGFIPRLDTSPEASNMDETIQYKFFDDCEDNNVDGTIVYDRYEVVIKGVNDTTKALVDQTYLIQSDN